LQSISKAEVAHSKELPFKYGEHSLCDYDILNLGNLGIEALYTPGHTNDSLCYVISEVNGNEATMVFTGDTLFVGDVGRTDLYGPEAQIGQVRKLYHSLHEKVLRLGDHVIVYPAHGSGSVCGHHISDREFSTIGYERKTNPLLKIEEDLFIKHVMKQKLLVPPYFSKMEQLNLNGPPLLKNAAVSQHLTVDEFEEEMRQPNTVILDTRETDAFAGSHIPGSLNIWLEGLGFYPGWVLTYNQRFLLVTDKKEDVETATSYLHRLGFDNIAGYLCQGISQWRNSGKPIEHLGSLSAIQLKKKLDLHEVVLIDVRSSSEWEEGYVEGAERIYVGCLAREASKLPRNRPIALTCSVGNRSGLAASILKNLGFENVYNVFGGMEAWKKLDYPLIKQK